MTALPSALSWNRLSLAASLLCAALFAVLIIYPALIQFLFGIASNASADFMSRRASILFLGLAAVTFLTRDEPDSAARRSIAVSLSLTMAGLALLGAAEFLRGSAGPGMVLAIAGEALFAGLYLPFCRQRKAHLPH